MLASGKCKQMRSHFFMLNAKSRVHIRLLKENPTSVLHFTMISRECARVLWFTIFVYTHFAQIFMFSCWFSRFPRVPFDKPQRGVFFVLNGLCVFQARKVRVRRGQCYRAACPVVQITSNYPSTGLYFRCYWQQLKLWLHWISSEAAIGREISLTIPSWIALWMIVECQC